MGEPRFNNRRRLDRERAWELYDMGYCDQQIADCCNVAFETVREWRRKFGLPGNKTPYKPVKKAKSGPTLDELAAEAKAHGMTYGKYIVAKQEGKV